MEHLQRFRKAIKKLRLVRLLFSLWACRDVFMRRNIPLAIYDLSRNPLTFDYVYFLYEADIYFRSLGYSSFDILLYIDSSTSAELNNKISKSMEISIKLETLRCSCKRHHNDTNRGSIQCSVTG